MAGTRAPLHLGGPLGALGLGCVGGAVALAVAALNNDPPPGNPAPGPAPALSVDIQSPSAPELSQIQTADADGRRADPATETLIPVAEVAQVQAAPAELPVRPARADGTEVHFIVRLKGAPEIDEITRNYKRDPAAAQTAWGELVTRLPGLADFSLAGASYSGEIKLAYQMLPGASATPEDIRAVQDRLLKVEGVSYADPDYVAHPGKD
jgi:plasmid stabilization system protein ParE